MVLGGGDRPAKAWRRRSFARRSSSALLAELEPRRLAGYLLGNLAAERDRWFLWVPVGLGFGIIIYFTISWEPPLWVGPAWTALAFASAYVFRRLPGLQAAALAVGIVGAGLAAAQVRTAWVAAPVLAERSGPVQVMGRVAEAQIATGKSRLLLEHVSLPDLAPEDTPERVRITVRPKEPLPLPGTWVTIRAVLLAPPEPAAPGAFDFARHAYYQRVGGVGYALGQPRVIAAPESEHATRPLLWLPAQRHQVANRILDALEGRSGAVAAALLTGKRSAIPDEVLSALRNSGLAHLLAISGLHMGLVAAILFFSLRSLLALCPPLALRYPIKKWAAAVALFGSFGYLLVSGASVPTQRAFLMTSLVLIAIVLDRTSISMRLIAWAAIVVLLIAPESLLGPSFQMSFAAATALIAVYEICRGSLARWSARSGLAMRPLVYLAGIGLTTLVAGLATGPFAIYTFNRFAEYGLAANLMAVPITGLWVMPWGVAAFLLMPFGLEAYALAPMGWGIEAVIRVAETVAGWPGAVKLLPVAPLGGLAAISLGGLWLCLWRRPWRVLGLCGFAVGAALMFSGQGPDVIVDGQAKLFAVRQADGELVLSSRRRARFAGEMWLRRDGQAVSHDWPSHGESEDGRLRCDGLGCIYRAEGRVVALVNDPRALVEDCGLASVVISLVPVRGNCGSAEVVIDRFSIWREGAHAVWLDEDEVRVESVAAKRGTRPWVIRRGWDAKTDRE